MHHPHPARTVDRQDVRARSSMSQARQMPLINCRTLRRHADSPHRFAHSTPAAENNSPELQAINHWGNPVLRKADAKAANDDNAKAQRAKRFGAGAKPPANLAGSTQYWVSDNRSESPAACFDKFVRISMLVVERTRRRTLTRGTSS